MAKSLNQGFETFLSNLVPLSSEHDKAKKHKDSVKSCLENNFDCYEFFETGSFGNATGVRHFSDTDYFSVLPSKKVFDDSGYTLNKVKEALENTFWNTEGICVNKPAVKIPFGYYASETLEVTPCTFNGLVDTPVGKQGSYDIPNYEGGWMKSSPKAHIAYVNREDIRLGYKLKPLIRLIKAWNFYNNADISSFYLELRTTKYAEGENAIVYDIDVKEIMKFLYEKELPNIQDPMGISGYVKACSTEVKRRNALSKVNTGYARAQKAYDSQANEEVAFHWWNLFFNDEFPNR